MSVPTLPAIVRGTVTHSRRGTRGHRFAHQTYQWLVDLDHPMRLPRGLRWAGTIDSRDHLGDPSRPIKTNVIEFVRLSGGNSAEIRRVVMLTNARVAGYVFNPLTVYWCFDGDDAQVAVVAEVHNTYRERHAYLVQPDEHGRCEIAKEFYVSPFNEIAGRYRITTTLDVDRVGVWISLTGDGVPDFTASFSGTPTAATAAQVVRHLVRFPIVTVQVSALIRIHGLWLWMRGHRVVRRPHHRPPPGV